MRPLDEELDACRELRELGFYAKAATQLRDCLTITHDLHVAADLGDTLVYQGYWQQSLQVLEDGIQNCTGSADNDLLRIQVQMQICFLKPIITGSFNESIKCAAKLHTDFLDLQSSTQLERTAVVIESYYSKVLQITANFHIEQLPRSIEDAIPRLENIFNDLIMHGRFAEAYTIASEFDRCVTIFNQSKDCLRDLPDGTALLKILSERPSVPMVVKAKAIDKLADIAEKSRDTTTSSNLEALAKDLFHQSGHAHGALDVLFRQACRNMREGVVDLDQEMESIKGYFQTYDDQDFLYGLHTSVLALMDSVANFFNFELQLTIAHDSEELATKGGAKLFWILHYTRILAQWLTHTGRTPTVIEGAKVLYKDLEGCDCQWLKGFVAQITAQAYLETDDIQNALEWSALCKYSWSFCSQIDIAESFTVELRCKLALPLDADAINTIIESTDITIEEETENGFVIPAIDQMDWILTKVFIPKNDKRLVPWLKRMEKLISQLDGIDADMKRGNLYQYHATSFLLEAKNRRDTKMEDEAIRFLEMAVPLYIKHKRLVEAANTRQMHGMVLLSIFQKSNTPQALQAAIDMFSIAYDAFCTLDNSVQISSSSYWCAFLAYRGWCHGWIDAHYVLNDLLLAESARDQERIELSILEGMEALAGKRNIGASKKVREVYNMALHICLHENNPQLLWEWLQKAKARSLSDLLGIGAQTSKALKSAIDSQDVTRDLFNNEKALLMAIRNGDAKERLGRRRELHSLQKQMRDYPALKAMMDLRDGSPVNLTALHSLLEETLSENAIPGSFSANLVFVDWFFTNGNVYLCTVQGQELPVVKKCNISQQSIELWKKKYLDSEGGRSQSIVNDDLDEDDPNYPLRYLDPLLGPLKDLRDKDAILILSVTDILHSIPMHALWVDGEPLITRNPIVYSASMTVFGQCWRQAATRKIEKPQVTMMAVFEPTPGTGFSINEQKRVYNEIHNLVSTPDATIITGAEGNRKSFMAAMESSALIHFHGHCRLDQAFITDQSLVLADGDFSVRDIFKQKLLGSHITLIACDSASQSVSAGDEPLGIVTALLCAGASSVLGTIWPTTSSTGRNFSAEFYAEMKRNPGGEILNLATALQKAVVNIRKERKTRHPCHWASFVLHGACFTRMNNGQVSSVG